MPKPNRITIRTIRELKQLSQRELGRRIGVSSGYIARVETGTRTPSWAKVQLIADEFNIPVEALTGDAP